MKHYISSSILNHSLLIPTVMVFLSPGTINDFMRSIGKIWVVVAALLIIFIGIVVFLFLLEKRISKLENDLDNE